MNQEAADQLEKILALADSDHLGEAVGAIRKARQILQRENLSFADLARAAHRERFTLSLPFFTGHQVVQLENQMAQAQRQIKMMTDEAESQKAQIEFWRRRATEMEQQIGVIQAETDRWRQMARETIEKLWDINQQTKSEEFRAPMADSGKADSGKADSGKMADSRKAIDSAKTEIEEKPRKRKAVG